MSEERGQYRTVAHQALPKDAQPEPKKKRLAPNRQRPIRHDTEKQAQEYGRVVSIRFPQEFVDMLRAADKKYPGGKRELVMLAVCPYIAALERGQTEVPVKSDGEVRIPEIPEIT